MRNKENVDIFRKFSGYIKKKYGWFILPSKIENSAFILGKLSMKFGMERVIAQFESGINHDLFNEVDDEIIDLFSVNETYFNREPETLATMATLTRETLRKKEGIKIFCAACSSGEEPYSIAIALGEEYLRGSVKITGGEINPKMIKMMESGVYTGWSLRTCSEDFKEGHFDQVDKRFIIKEKYRKNLEVKRYNLLSRNTTFYFGETKFDIILCRNLFLYMQPAAIDVVTENLIGMLEPGGFFITGLAEGALSEKLKSNKYEGYGNIFRF